MTITSEFRATLVQAIHDSIDQLTDSELGQRDMIDYHVQKAVSRLLTTGESPVPFTDVQIERAAKRAQAQAAYASTQPAILNYANTERDFIQGGS